MNMHQMNSQCVMTGLISAVVIVLGTAALAETGTPPGKVSVWSGVYTSAQDERGKQIHSANCNQCHGVRLNGAGQPDMPSSPAIARAGFLRKWSGRPVAELAEYIRTKMPPDTPGRLNEQESVDAIAHMLAVSNVPAGNKELPSDPAALAGIVIQAEAP
jgi:mono/diheme cytochrome c family protein